MDIEKALLAHMHDRGALAQCWENGLRDEVFEIPLHQQVYRFAVDYWVGTTMQHAPTRDVIDTEFPDLDLGTADEALPWLIERLKARFRTNEVQQILREAATLATDDPHGSLELMFDASMRAKEVTAPRIHRVNMADTVAERRDRYSARQNDQARGVPIGLPEVDAHTGGILPGEVAIVAGYAKTGKSFFLLKAAAEAHDAGLVPYVASLEQDLPEFEDRLDAMQSGVGYGLLSRGQLTMDDVRRLHASQDRRASQGPLHLERPPTAERTVANLVNRARRVGADYLIIDQLSWLQSRHQYRDRRDMYLELIQDLKEECSKPSHPMPCLMAVQYNRQAVSTPGQRGGMHNIANAADIEQTIDIAYGLYRNREIRANNSMVLDILGARRCDNGSWLLEWQLERQTAISVRGVYEEDGADT